MSISLKKIKPGAIPEIGNILKSGMFERSMHTARKYGNRPVRALAALSLAVARSASLADKGKLGELKANLKDMGRMLKAYFRREYRTLPYATVLKCLAAVLYFLFVADLIPDFIPGLGLLDDAAVLAWVASSVRGELDKFNKWERNRLPEAHYDDTINAVATLPHKA